MTAEINFYILRYGYMAIFILIFLQEIGIPNPIPNELVLFFSGYLSFTGMLKFSLIILAAVAADFIGTNILYFVFFYFGAYIIKNKPRWFPISETTINKVIKRVSDGNLWTIFIGRLTPFLRGYTSVITGLLQIKPKVFLPIAFFSAISWSVFYVLAGVLSGPYWRYFADNPAKFIYIILVIFLIAMAASFLINKNNRASKKRNKKNLSIVAGKQYDPIKVHLVAETPHSMRGQGVHTSFIHCIELLKEKNDVEVIVNGQGWGDVFHAHTYGPYYFWKGRKYKGRRIHTAHVIPDSIIGSLPMWKYLYPLSKWYFKKVFSYADIVIAISPMVEKKIKMLNIDTNIIRIDNPIISSKWIRTPEKRKEGRDRIKVSSDDFIVLGVGQLQSRKGVEDFIEIAETIPEAKFIWVGGRPFGVLTEGIKRINERIKKVSKHIHFFGMVELEDMPFIYAAADVLIFPSYQENCPLAPLEAAASGIPVVFRDIIEYNLLYQHPYLKALNNNEFSNLLKRLISDKEFYNAGVEMSKILITQFDKEKIRAQYIDLYRGLLSQYQHEAIK